MSYSLPPATSSPTTSLFEKFALRRDNSPQRSPARSPSSRRSSVDEQPRNLFSALAQRDGQKHSDRGTPPGSPLRKGLLSLLSPNAAGQSGHSPSRSPSQKSSSPLVQDGSPACRRNLANVIQGSPKRNHTPSQSPRSPQRARSPAQNIPGSTAALSSVQASDLTFSAFDDEMESLQPLPDSESDDDLPLPIFSTAARYEVLFDIVLCPFQFSAISVHHLAFDCSLAILD